MHTDVEHGLLGSKRDALGLMKSVRVTDPALTMPLPMSPPTGPPAMLDEAAKRHRIDEATAAAAVAAAGPVSLHDALQRLADSVSDALRTSAAVHERAFRSIGYVVSELARRMPDVLAPVVEDLRVAEQAQADAIGVVSDQLALVREAAAAVADSEMQ
jgi:hypothetical protein